MTARAAARHMAAIEPTHVHIATEGPIGFATRRACLDGERSFTTSYHTRFPEYVSARLPVPERWSYAVLRRFHERVLAEARVQAQAARRDEFAALA